MTNCNGLAASYKGRWNLVIELTKVKSLSITWKKTHVVVVVFSYQHRPHMSFIIHSLFCCFCCCKVVQWWRDNGRLNGPRHGMKRGGKMSSQTTGEGPSSSQVRMDEQGVLFSMTGMPGISPPPVSNSSSAQQCARDKMAMSCAPTHAVDRSGLFSALLCASTKLPPPPPTVLFDIFLESLSLSLFPFSLPGGGGGKHFSKGTFYFLRSAVALPLSLWKKNNFKPFCRSFKSRRRRIPPAAAAGSVWLSASAVTFYYLPSQRWSDQIWNKFLLLLLPLEFKEPGHTQTLFSFIDYTCVCVCV